MNHCDQVLKAVDFFCGAGGMSYGLSRAGIKILAGIDVDYQCKETYEHNNKPAKFIQKDIRYLKNEELKEEIGIRKNDDSLIFVGCSPCQFWSKINTDKTKSESSAFLISEFRRFVKYFNPGYILIENVPGLKNKNEKTSLPEFLQFLEQQKYVCDNDVVNAIRFGVPQNRNRFLLIASRRHRKIVLPKGRRNKRLTVRNFIGKIKSFPPIIAGHVDKPVRMHTAAALSNKNLQRIRTTPHDGGDRFAWRDDPELQIPAYEGKDKNFMDVYARMWWDRPAPTITTRFNSLSNGRFGHPDQDRALSLREGATLQTFPKRYRFICSSQAAKARLIGNAVPPALAERIGKHLIRIDKNGKV
ncbi:DNA cytosine methyltransferase [uncultured Desulfosarcina sp.]|uniref:DNA cytosine methyltransferase n=1 Tax=uncultured Desulfosarcina sp. TaxID=218289 RepID=UPI0029C953D5|nr:DNA cytosine methyltransferase [uncultured Desulfosarcina sp.]